MPPPHMGWGGWGILGILYGIGLSPVPPHPKPHTINVCLIWDLGRSRSCKILLGGCILHVARCVKPCCIEGGLPLGGQPQARSVCTTAGSIGVWIPGTRVYIPDLLSVSVIMCFYEYVFQLLKWFIYDESMTNIIICVQVFEMIHLWWTYDKQYYMSWSVVELIHLWWTSDK